MALRRPPSDIWRDYEEIMADMRRRFGEMMRGYGRALPEPEMPSAGITIDVREHEDEVLVAADLPGVEKQDIRVRLLDPRTLRISTERREEREEEREGFYLRERTYGAMSRAVPLPADVTEEGVSTSFTNGVLEVRLRKTAEARGKEIPIE
ncbi:MAG: Hsp20/alpha crystallin family protein [Methanomicrobiaceae archaeon]|uniref:Small heat shock protein n=1 Tax=hydrocarbon metagenome TaxID=938273 RepID=A0A0W8FFJ9_9ZZZZ|nr:Hsp20/alpha crystallin family protein [Methanomicrobiaceae archaeon]MDD5419591.1 Hsp20/alpha crystallin family protein [Methanomicrobiaceae archaeon]